MLTNLIAIFCTIILVTLGLQYLMIFVNLKDGYYYYKKDVLIDLIPFKTLMVYLQKKMKFLPKIIVDFTKEIKRIFTNLK